MLVRINKEEISFLKLVFPPTNFSLAVRCTLTQKSQKLPTIFCGALSKKKGPEKGLSQQHIPEFCSKIDFGMSGRTTSVLTLNFEEKKAKVAIFVYLFTTFHRSVWWMVKTLKTSENGWLYFDVNTEVEG